MTVDETTLDQALTKILSGEAKPGLSDEERTVFLDVFTSVLVDDVAIAYFGYKVRQILGFAPLHGPLSEGHKELVIAGNFDALDESEFAELLVNNMGHFELRREILKSPNEFWAPIIADFRERNADLLTE